MQIGSSVRRLLVAIAIIYFALVPLAVAQVGAGAAITTTNVNMRAGPGTNYAVVAVLHNGDQVFVNRCSRGWCLSDFGRDRGWISDSFLRQLIASPGGGGRPIPDNPNRPNININIGAGGVSIGSGRACFFERDNFRGRSFCLRQGESERNLGRWESRIGSIMIEGRSTTAEICLNRNFGNCSAFNRNTPILNFTMQQSISSVRVR